ncbi:hypothetical protein A6J64_017790 [Yersinia enterocolitica]|nr:hypothetical protein A6J64_017790 [Yersinia enterocolitica]
MFCIPVKPLHFFDINQSFNPHGDHAMGKFMFYINFINLTYSNFFVNFQHFLHKEVKKTSSHHRRWFNSFTHRFEAVS